MFVQIMSSMLQVNNRVFELWNCDDSDINSLSDISTCLFTTIMNNNLIIIAIAYSTRYNKPSLHNFIYNLNELLM